MKKNINNDSLIITIADKKQRKEIYKIKYNIYSLELKQYPENKNKILKDNLDDYNIYIIAIKKNKIIGFISITPPCKNYSIDKYIERKKMPFAFNGGLYEIRILTLLNKYRGSRIFYMLCYAAFKWIEFNNGTRIMILAKKNLVSMYMKGGLKSYNICIKAGSVDYELLSATVQSMKKPMLKIFNNIGEYKNIKWDLNFPIKDAEGCFHGGGYINDDLSIIENPKKLHGIITADILDSWFNPAPKIVTEIKKNIKMLIKTSPPVTTNNIEKTLADSLGVNLNNILIGAGSSDLIYLAIPQLINKNSKVLLINPSYGEYYHILKNVIKCKIDEYILTENNNFKIDVNILNKYLNNEYDMTVIVNPNNPTCSFLGKNEIIGLVKSFKNTKFWIDETYIDFMGNKHSLVQSIEKYSNLIICKSLSKIFGLSGIRAGYLCTNPDILDKIKKINPPWNISFITQIAVYYAVKSSIYYKKKYIETVKLREKLCNDLSNINQIKIINDNANFIFCKLVNTKINLNTLVEKCKNENVYIRNVSNMGSGLKNYYFRISVKSKKENKIIYNILKKILNGYKNK